MEEDSVGSQGPERTVALKEEKEEEDREEKEEEEEEEKKRFLIFIGKKQCIKSRLLLTQNLEHQFISTLMGCN